MKRNPSDAAIAKWIARLKAQIGFPKTLAQALELQAAFEKLGKIDVENVMEVMNKALDGHGVEAIRDLNKQDRYWWDVVAIYVNFGDPYITTILYDVENDRFERTAWGDWAEQYEQDNPDAEL